jgi:hypothetical protein
VSARPGSERLKVRLSVEQEFWGLRSLPTHQRLQGGVVALAVTASFELQVIDPA